MFDGIRDTLDILNRDSKVHLEAMNLLVSLVNVNKIYPIPKSKFVDEIFRQNESLDKLDYFQLIILFYFIEDSKECSYHKSSLIDAVFKKFIKTESCMLKSEMVLLFFDFIACPNIDKVSKNKLIKIVYKSLFGNNPTDNRVGRIRNYIAANNWFIDWNTNDINLEYVLAKKEYNPPYSE